MDLLNKITSGNDVLRNARSFCVTQIMSMEKVHSNHEFLGNISFMLMNEIVFPLLVTSAIFDLCDTRVSTRGHKDEIFRSQTVASLQWNHDLPHLTHPYCTLIFHGGL